MVRGYRNARFIRGSQPRVILFHQTPDIKLGPSPRNLTELLTSKRYTDWMDIKKWRKTVDLSHTPLQERFV